MSYEMRISDWSSDVCSSDLRSETHYGGKPLNAPFCINQKSRHSGNVLHAQERVLRRRHRLPEASCNRSMVSRRSFVVCGSPASVRGCRLKNYDQGWESAVGGMRVSGRVAIGGRRLIEQKKK